jgi:FKBP-type peptidyl-prolyl cis-trans isomerase FkpA
MRHHLQFTRRAGAALLMSFAAGCLNGTEPGTPSNPATETFAASLGVNLSQMTKVSNDLYYQDLVVGTGTAVVAGKTVNVTYTGWLVNGTTFDSNVGGPLASFPIGVGAVIAGWDLGLPGMKAGGKRRLVIGSNLAYGAGGRGSIPPNATLVFDVLVASVQ